MQCPCSRILPSLFRRCWRILQGQKFTQDIKPVRVISKDQFARRENILAVKQSEEYHHETRIDDIPRDFAGKSDKTAEQRMAEAVEKAEASWGVRPMTEQSVSEQPQAPAEAVPEPENIPEPAAEVPETAQSSENEKEGYIRASPERIRQGKRGRS
ncbi:MAG: hypothetical protein L6V87_10315 [Ruminococcus sp.]|nr:MAG: hypothetical protein L6V87_10315 [Ruminococcus sp.]